MRRPGPGPPTAPHSRTGDQRRGRDGKEFVAVGLDGSGAAVWTSADGAAWDKAPAGPGFAGARLTSVSPGAVGLVAVGYDGSGAHAWTSPDGKTWVGATGAADLAGSQALGVPDRKGELFAIGDTVGVPVIWVNGPEHVASLKGSDWRDNPNVSTPSSAERNSEGAGRRRLSRKEAQAETRRRVLDAAAEVFGERGFRAASLSDVADRAGYTIGAVYSNFASKDALFHELIEGAAPAGRGRARRG